MGVPLGDSELVQSVGEQEEGVVSPYLWRWERGSMSSQVSINLVIHSP
jgi:hypothetical protein